MMILIIQNNYKVESKISEVSKEESDEHGG